MSIDGAALSAVDVTGALSGERADLARSLADAGESAAAAQEFEALLGTMLVKELRRALPTGFFGETSGADTYEGWLDETLGRELAKSGSLDLAGMVKVSLDSKARAGRSES